MTPTALLPLDLRELLGSSTELRWGSAMSCFGVTGQHQSREVEWERQRCQWLPGVEGRFVIAEGVMVWCK